MERNKTGLTTFFINDKIDQGDIILQKEICISENMTAGQLHNQMIKDGSKLIIETLQLIDENRVTLKLQSEENNFKNAQKSKKNF